MKEVSQETNTLRFLLVEVPRVVTFTEMESRTWLWGVGGRGEWGVLFDGTEFQFYKMKGITEVAGGW